MSGGVDICDILIFISKTDDLIPVMDDKKVDVQLSRLDVAANTLTLSYTDAGIIEKLLGKLKAIRHSQQPPISFPTRNCRNLAKLELGQHRSQQQLKLHKSCIFVPPMREWKRVGGQSFFQTGFCSYSH